MKTLIAALLLSLAAAPAAFAMPVVADLIIDDLTTGVGVPGDDGFDRRSGRCPKRANAFGREGSTCGGV